MNYFKYFLSFCVLASSVAWGQLTPLSQSQLPKNYIKNGGFEATKAGWSTYKTTAQALPTTCSGGSPSTTLASSTTSPIAGSASGVITKPASNVQGEGVSYAFTVDPAGQGRVMQIQTAYQVTSGTFSGGTSSTDSDLEVYIYDVDGAQVIQPSGYKFDGNQSTNVYQIKASFQTSISSTNYRLCYHIPTTSTSAWTVKIDNVVVGQTAYTTGVAAQDYNAGTTMTFTASTSGTFTPGTTTANIIKYARLGQMARIYFNYAATSAGTNGTGNIEISLPAGLVADTSKVSGVYTGTDPTVVRQYWLNGQISGNTGASNGTQGSAYLYDSTHFCLSYLVGAGAYGIWGSASLGMANTTTNMQGWFEVPIVGWSTNSVVSDSADTRVVAASAHVSSAASTTAGNPFNFDTVDVDTHGGVTTGATTWKYTVPTPGNYLVSVSIFGGATSGGLYVYKNGSAFRGVGTTISSSSTGTGATIVPCVAGDTIDIRAATTMTPSNGSAPGTVANTNHISISKILGPSQIAAVESVSFSATTSTTAATTASPYIFTTVVKDSHSAYSVSTGKYTIPAPGQYRITGQVVTGGSASDLDIYKNGTKIVAGLNSTSSNMPVSASWPFVAGDLVDLRPSASQTANGSTTANYFMIERMGN